MRNERGFALITALWLIAALSAVVGLEIGTARLGQQVTINRITLTRSRWAADACLAIAQARWQTQRRADTASIDLGERTQCHWRQDDPAARINVNTADAEILARALADSTLVSSLLTARRSSPFASVEQLPGQYRSLCTVDGSGTININAALPAVLAALPGITAEAVERIVSRRSLGRPIMSLDELGGVLSSPARAVLLQRYADLARVVTFRPPQLVITAQGWVDGRAPVATIEAVVVPLPERLAVIRRRMW